MPLIVGIWPVLEGHFLTAKAVVNAEARAEAGEVGYGKSDNKALQAQATSTTFPASPLQHYTIAPLSSSPRRLPQWELPPLPCFSRYSNHY